MFTRINHSHCVEPVFRHPERRDPLNGKNGTARWFATVVFVMAPLMISLSSIVRADDIATPAPSINHLNPSIPYSPAANTDDASYSAPMDILSEEQALLSEQSVKIRSEKKPVENTLKQSRSITLRADDSISPTTNSSSQFVFKSETGRTSKRDDNEPVNSQRNAAIESIRRSLR